jgi:hypothetical protein
MPNPSINTDWLDKAAPAGYVKRWGSPMNIRNTLIFVTALLLSYPASAQMIKSTLPGFQAPAPESDYDKKLLDDVSIVGWHHVYVQPEGGKPGFAFSLGFYANYKHPEIIVFGLPPNTAQQLLNINAIAVAGAKTKYEAYKPYDTIAQGMRIAFVPVAKRHYPTYLGYAGWFYKSVASDFPVLQMVWPDKQGRLPWEVGYDNAFSKFQPILDK